jgi:hypothetical protein
MGGRETHLEGGEPVLQLSVGAQRHVEPDCCYVLLLVGDGGVEL